MNRKKIILAGILLGIGLGGFVDGIVFHQIFQLHSMLSAKLPQDTVVNIKTSMVWDGLFHFITWISTLAGLITLWNTMKQKPVRVYNQMLTGSMLAGWGLFNFSEGIIDHYILQVHHVVERLGLSIYDYIFVASGLFFLWLGMTMAIRQDSPDPTLQA